MLFSPQQVFSHAFFHVIVFVFVRKVAENVFKSIASGECLAQPSLLCSFLLVTYADLKNYKYHYW